MSDTYEFNSTMNEPQEQDFSGLNFRQRTLRDMFVREYFVDYDPLRAAIRVGYPSNIAKEYSTMLMQDPYVLQQIRKRETEDESASPEEMRKRIIAQLMREANYNGPGASAAARVAANKALAEIYNVNAPSKNPNEMLGPDGQPIDGGVFVVPGVVTTEQWASMAQKQQDDLVNGRIAQAPQVH